MRLAAHSQYLHPSVVYTAGDEYIYIYIFAKGMIEITFHVSKEHQNHDGRSEDHHQALGRSQELHPKSSFEMLLH